MRWLDGGFKRSAIAGALSCVAVLTATALASAARADEIRLLASNAVREPYLEILPDFKATAHRIVVDWGGTVDIVKRAGDGEAADIVIIPDGRVNDLVKRGVVVERVDLARSGIGIAGRADTSRPALSNVADLRQTLVSAKSIVLSSGPSSAHMLALFGKMGIANEIKPKLIQLAPGLSVGEAIAEGKGEIGFTQTSELLSVKGINYLGPLPPEIRTFTMFSAGLLAAARSPDAARALIGFLSAPSVGPVLRKHGLDPERSE